MSVAFRHSAALAIAFAVLAPFAAAAADKPAAPAKAPTPAPAAVAAAPASSEPAAPVFAAAPPPAAQSEAAPSSVPAITAPPAQEVENPYGLGSLWAQGDFVAKGTISILLIMSIGTWYIAVLKLIEQSRLLAQAKTTDKEFWKTNSVDESISQLKPGNAFRAIAESGASALRHHEGTLVEHIDLNTWVTISIQRATDTINARLQAGLAFLATVGSTAPFVGLFGTVWGIYHALIAIGLAGQASIDKVAGPVGEALIMTAIGLAVAVPAVLGYNWLVRRNKAINERVKIFSSELHSVLLSGGAASQRHPSRQAA